MSKKLTLQEQLLQAGLVSKSKAQTVKTEKNKQVQQQRHHKIEVVDETKLLVQKAQAEKAAKDKALNEQRQKLEAQRQLNEQISQIIEQHKVEKKSRDDDTAYNFTDNGKVKKIYVSNETRELLIKGRIAIVSLENRYVFVGFEATKRIEELDKSRVLVFNAFVEDDVKEDDPYADYQIPDDLMW